MISKWYRPIFWYINLFLLPKFIYIVPFDHQICNIKKVYATIKLAKWGGSYLVRGYKFVYTMHWLWEASHQKLLKLETYCVTIKRSWCAFFYRLHSDAHELTERIFTDGDETGSLLTANLDYSDQLHRDFYLWNSYLPA